MNSKKTAWFSLMVAVMAVSAFLVPATAALAEGPLHIIFVSTRAHIHRGECALLEWHVEGGFVVLLQGQPVPSMGSREVCPQQTKVFSLDVDLGDRMEHRELAIAVEGSGPAAQETAAQPGPLPAPPPGPKHPPVPQPAPKGPVSISFRADRTNLNSGECTTLRWDVENVNEVYLDGKGVVGHSSKKVCPPGGRTYVLHVVHPGGPTEKRVTVKVSGSAPAPPQPKNPQPGKGGVDLAITDLYPGNLPYGRVWVRVTNNGPQSLNNARVQLKCNAFGKNLSGGTPWSHVEAPWQRTVSLNPGQTVNIQTAIKLDTTKFMYDVTCSVSPPSNGAGYSDPNWSNNNYSESIASKAGTGPQPGKLLRANAAVTDLFAKNPRGGKLFARITNHGPDSLKNAHARLFCQGAGWQGGKAVPIASSGAKTLTLNPGQTGIFDTGITINIDQYDYFEMTCRVEAIYSNAGPYSERIP